MKHRTNLSVATIALATISIGSAAEARRPYRDGGSVTAYSRYNNGAVSGAIRSTSVGWEVRLPRGSWVGCRRSCEETLRVETVDIYERDDHLFGYGAVQNECGIFGCLDIR